LLASFGLKKHQKYILYSIKTIVAITLIAYLINQISEHQDILTTLYNVDIKWIFFSILMMIPNILLQAYKWWVLVKNINPSISFWEACGSTLGGISLGILTPGRIGELGKGLFIDHVEKWQITGLALLDRVFNMSAIMILGISSFIFILKNIYETSIIFYLPFAIIIFILLCFFIYFLLNPEILRAAYNKFDQLHKFKKQTKLFFSSIKILKKKPVVLVFIISLIFQFVVAVQFIMLVIAFDANLGWLDGFLASFSTVMTKASLPISIAEIGIRETAADYFFGLFITNRAAIFNGSIVLFVINVLFPSLLGIFMLPKLNFQRDLTD
jgi:uncharacterized membrane protein YbhN (UPF0104 family)